MFFVLGAVLVFTVAWVYATQGPRLAIAVVCGCALLYPSWVACHMGPTVCNLRSLGCLLALGIVIATSFRVFPGGLMLADLIVAALAASQIYTEYTVGDLSPSTLLSTLLEWVVPYLLGRIACESIHDLRRLTTIMAWVCLGLSALAIVESVTRINVLNVLLGHAGSLQGEGDIRWGMKRAEGPVTHPIFFGLMLVMVLPWAFEAARRAMNGDGPKWWQALPWITAAAACCPMSRGPQIGVMLCAFVVFFLRNPAHRKGLAIVAIAVSVTGAVAYRPMLHLLHVWSNERPQAKETVVIGGAAVEYSGTNHRLLQLTVYQDAVLHAGWSGYGLMCMSTRPSRIPYVEDQLREMFFSIDNHYLWMLLKAGYGGVTLFVLLGLTALKCLVKPALTLDAPHSLLAAGLLATILAVMVLVTTVFFAADFGFLWLFNIGLSASLRKCFDARNARARGPLVWPSLAPGHPVRLPAMSGAPSSALPS